MYLMKSCMLIIVIFLFIGCEIKISESPPVISGCMNEAAINYNAEAANDDGSCILDNYSGAWQLSGWAINDGLECTGDATDDSELQIWGVSTLLTLSAPTLTTDGTGVTGTLVMVSTDGYGYTENYTGTWISNGNTLTATCSGSCTPYPTSYALGSGDSITLTGDAIVADKCNQYTFTKN